MKEIKKTVYTFAELLEEEKQGKIDSSSVEKARRWLQDSVTDVEWYDFVFEWWTEALNQIGFIEPDISFRGFGSQGDGACFTCKNVDFEALLDFLTSGIHPENVVSVHDGKEDFRAALLHKIGGMPQAESPHHLEWLKLIADEWLDAEVFHNSRYNHAHSCHFRIEPIRCAVSETFEEVIRDLEETCEQLRFNMSKAIYRDLEQEYWDITSDEALIETCNANDWHFDSRGTFESC